MKPVEYLKELIEKETKYKVNEMVLKFKGTVLNDHATLKNCEIYNNDRVDLSLKKNISGEKKLSSSGILVHEMGIFVKNVKLNIRRKFIVEPSTKIINLK